MQTRRDASPLLRALLPLVALYLLTQLAVMARVAAERRASPPAAAASPRP